VDAVVKKMITDKYDRAMNGVNLTGEIRSINELIITVYHAAGCPRRWKVEEFNGENGWKIARELGDLEHHAMTWIQHEHLTKPIRQLQQIVKVQSDNYRQDQPPQ
jgi:hypothetical protein